LPADQARAWANPLWRHQLFAWMSNERLTLLIGQYSQKYYLSDRFKPTLTENIRNYRHFLPRYLPLVQPSLRNRFLAEEK